MAKEDRGGTLRWDGGERDGGRGMITGRGNGGDTEGKGVGEGEVAPSRRSM